MGTHTLRNHMIIGFETKYFVKDGVEIAYDIGGSGPPLLLLHGFPQNRALWAKIAPLLAARFTVICPDLRGYGQSSKPKDTAAYSFRAMAQDQLALMQNLGFTQFHVAGHDRGARVAHRLCLDMPQYVKQIALMDIVPTRFLLDTLNKEVAKAYFHWFFLAQPSPIPEKMIGADPDMFFDGLLGGWGDAGLTGFDPHQLNAYRHAWRDPETIRAMCEDYRAGITADYDNDKTDQDRLLPHPALILMGSHGIMAQQYDMRSAWQNSFSNAQFANITGGHFFLDTHPEASFAALNDFFLAF